MTSLLIIGLLVIVALLLVIVWCYRVEAGCLEIEKEFFVGDAVAWRQAAGSLRKELSDATSERNELRVRVQLADAKVASQRELLDRIASDIGPERLTQLVAERQARRRICADRADFAAGELDPARAAAFRDHLGSCEKCPRELLGDVVLGARLSEREESGR